MNPTLTTRLTALSILLALFAPLPKLRAVNTATTSGNWFDTSIWSMGTVPTSGDGEVDEVQIAPSAGGVDVSISTGNASTNAPLRIGIGGVASNTATLTMTSGTFTAGSSGIDPAIHNSVGVSSNRTGVLDLQGGLFQTTGDRQLRIGAAAGSTGILTQSGGTILLSNQFHIGESGVGIATLSGGLSSYNNEIHLAQVAGSVGTLHVTGTHDAVLQSHINVGQNGDGHLIVSGGTLRHAPGVIDRSLKIGDQATSTSTVEISGDGVVLAGQHIIVGQFGNGTLRMTGGSAVAGTHLFLANNPAASGHLEMTGGVLEIGQQALIGDNGTGTVLISGGTIRTTEEFTIGQSIEGYGSINMTGGLISAGEGVTMITDHVNIGNRGTGVLNMSGGTLQLRRTAGTTSNDFDNGDIRVGAGADSRGTVNISGTAVIEAGRNFIIGNTGITATTGASGVVNMSGGRIGVEENFIIANGREGTGVLNMFGGLIETDILDVSGGNSGAGFVIIGDEDHGTANISGGTILVGVNDHLDLRIGARAASLGSAHVTGGLIDARDFKIGEGSTTTQNDKGDGRTVDGTSGTAILPAVGHLTLDGGTLHARNSLFIGQRDDSAGTLTMLSGLIQLDSDSSGADGNFVMASDARFSVGDGVTSFNGDNASRAFALISGGTVNGLNFEIAQGGDADATFNGTARINVSNTLFVANGSGTGALNIGGDATVDVATDFVVAATADATGSFNMSGGHLDVANIAQIGEDGTGSATMSGGTIEVGDDLRIGGNSGSLGSILQTGGLIRSNIDDTGTTIVGNNGTGFLTVDGGTFKVGPDESIGVRNPPLEGRDLYIGSASTGVGKLVLLNDALVQTAGRTRIGSSGSGTLEVHGGTFTSDGQILVGTSTGSVGTLILTNGYIDTDFDNNVTNFRRLVIGNLGDGFANVSGGTIEVGGNLWVGNGSGSVGTFLQSGGLIKVARANSGEQLAIGRQDGSLGFARISGGTLDHLVSAGSLDNFDVGFEGTGTLEVAGNALVQTPADLTVGTEATGDGTLNASGGTLLARNLKMGVDGHGDGTISDNALVLLSDSANIAVGNGTGLLTQTGGTLVARNRVQLGNGGSSLGSVNIADGQVVIDSITSTAATNFGPGGNIGVGVQGVGALVVDGDNQTLNVANRLRIGDQAGSSGTYVQTGGLTNVGVTMRVGSDGDGHASISGGTLNIGQHFRIGRNAGSFGSMNVSGGLINTHLTLGGNDVVGQQGTGFLTIDGGTILIKPQAIGMNVPGEENANFDVGSEGNGFGHLVLNSGLIQSARGIRAGSGSATGIIEINGGTMTADGNLNLGRSAGGNGSLIMTDGLLRTNFDNSGATFRDMVVGAAGTGSAAISGGTTIVGGGLFVANESTASGTMNMTAGRVDIGLGDDGSGSGGAFRLNIGAQAGSNGFAHISGGTLTAHDTTGTDPGIRVGDQGTGALVVDGSAIVESRNNFTIGNTAGSTGSVSIAGGHVKVDNDFVIANDAAASATLTQTGGLFEVDGSIINTNGGTHTFSGGTLSRSIAGNIDYQGDLSISSTATIRFDADKTLSVTGSFDVAGGGIFDLSGVELTLGTDEHFFLTIGNPGDFTDDLSLEGVMLTGLIHPLGATRISEFDFETGNFGPTQSVYALVADETFQSLLGIRWRTVPEPSRTLLLVLGLATLAGRRRR